MVVVIGLIMVTAPAAAWSTTYSWSGPGYQSPFSSLGGFYSPYGMPGSSPGYGSPFGYNSLLGGYGSQPGGYGSMFGGSPFSNFGSSPTGYYGTPTKTSNSLSNSDLLSNFGGLGDVFGGSIFNDKKDYGTPPTANITKALVGQNLTYDSSFMGIPLEYTLDKSDIGDATGMQYKGDDAWKVRVGQAGIYWDVIMDADGNNILAADQV